MTSEPLRLGNYTTLAELASGGMGTLYLARHSGAAGFERLVVLKRVHKHLLKSREFVDMLRDEARLASQIRHPNVVSVDDVVEGDGELFLVQPYIESATLADLLKHAKARGERLPPPVALRIVADALAGLSGAHEAVDMNGEPLLVVHRDVSPSNVLVGGDGRSRLIDFGIAKAASRATVTTSGVLKGKLAYMAPEQFKRLPLDARADVFAAGVVLYEALTGARPFDGADEGDTLLSILIAEPPPPSTLAEGVPESIDRVIEKALARDRDERYPTAAAFLEALESAAQLASAKEVAAYALAACGDELQERRRLVKAAREGPPSSGRPARAKSRTKVAAAFLVVATAAVVLFRATQSETAPASAAPSVNRPVVAVAAPSVVGASLEAEVAPIAPTPSSAPTSSASAGASSHARTLVPAHASIEAKRPPPPELHKSPYGAPP